MRNDFICYIHNYKKLNQKIKARLALYENGTLKYPHTYYKEGQSPLYDYDETKLKTLDQQNKVKSFINNFLEGYKNVNYFYRTHEETDPTEKECYESIDYLKGEKSTRHYN